MAKRSRVSFAFIILATVLVLLCFAGIYYLLEQAGLAPVIVLQNENYTAGENALIFGIVVGGIVFLGLLVTFLIFRVRIHRGG